MKKKVKVTKRFIDWAVFQYDDINKTDLKPYKKFSTILTNVKAHFKDDPHFKKVKDPEQSWKTILGAVLEALIEHSLEKELGKINLICRKPSKVYMKKHYSQMIEQLSVNIGHNKILPDSDRIVYQENPFIILANLSIKKKFRERIAQVGYWTIQLREAKKDIKNIMVTTDEDGTFSKPKLRKDGVKAKVIAQEHTNGTFVASEAEIEENGNVKKFDKIINFLKELKKNGSGSDLFAKVK